MYMYIHTCLCVYMCVYIYIYMCVCSYICVNSAHEPLSVVQSVRTGCVSLFVYMCIYVYMYICVSLYICMYIHICMCV